jgi:hypothetical protein
MNPGSYLCQCGVPPDMHGPDVQGAAGVDGPGDDAVARMLGHGPGFACDHALVHVAGTPCHHPVSRDLQTGHGIGGDC